MREIQIIILAAGLGTRLGVPLPKPLTPLADGRSILRHQLDHLRQTFADAARIAVVVGFRYDLIIGAEPEVRFVYNERYDETNTARSLLKALRTSHSGGVLWLNGDVVFDRRVLERAQALIESDRTFACVNTVAVGAEEVKYRTDADGYLTELSKSVVDGRGEAVGLNYVSSADKAALIEHLERCTDQDFFERGMESAIMEGRLRVQALDISDCFVVEVDFADDLERANTEVSTTVTPAA
jgi:CDP-glycerol glycerophosphotransferase